MTIRLSRRKLRRWLRWSLGLLVLVAGLWGPYALGRQISPAPGVDGQIPLYSPSVRRTERYRRQAQRWLDTLHTLDAQLVAALRTDAGDVYGLSRQGQTALDRAADLSQDIALTYPPASLVTLRDALQLTADRYLETAVALNRWIGEPTPANQTVALESLRQARTLLLQAAANPRLQEPTGPDDLSPAISTPASPDGPAFDPGDWGDGP